MLTSTNSSILIAEIPRLLFEHNNRRNWDVHAAKIAIPSSSRETYTKLGLLIAEIGPFLVLSNRNLSKPAWLFQSLILFTYPSRPLPQQTKI
jgi:hypothetical protein